MSLSNCRHLVRWAKQVSPPTPQKAAEVSRWPWPLLILIQVCVGRLTLCPGGLSCLWWYDISFKVPEETLWYRVRCPLCPSVRLLVRQFVLFLCYSGNPFSLWIPVWPLLCLSPRNIAAFILHPLVFFSAPTVCVPRCRPCRIFSLRRLFSLWPLVCCFFLVPPSMQNPLTSHSAVLFQGCDTWRIPDKSKSFGRHTRPGIIFVFLSSSFFHCVFSCVVLLDSPFFLLSS